MDKVLEDHKVFKNGRGTETSRRTLNVGIQAASLKEAEGFLEE